jgi:hypothetical protein
VLDLLGPKYQEPSIALTKPKVEVATWDWLFVCSLGIPQAIKLSVNDPRET